MPANDVYMDYSTVAAAAKEVEKYKDDFETLLSDLDTLASDLDGMWQGCASDGFKEAYNKLRPQLKNFSDMLTVYQTELNQAVADSCSVQTQNANRIDRNLSLR